MEEAKPASDEVRDAVHPRGPGSVAEPEKELRFTRARQARIFYGFAVVSFAASMAVIILATQDWGMDEPLLRGWWWLCLPALLICFWMFRLAVRCTRHAYIILSPLGVEIFPFFNAEQNLRIIYWSQVVDAELKEGKLLLHFDQEKKSGVIASLKPVPAPKQKMLERAVCGVLAKRSESSGDT